MWILFALGVFVALLLFDRFRKFSIPAPLAVLLSVGIVIAPFILVPIVVVWLVLRWVGRFRSKKPSIDSAALSFCSRCGMDLPIEGEVCPNCGNSVQVTG